MQWIEASKRRNGRHVESRIEEINSFERVRLSADTRLLLCAVAAGDLRRPLPPLDADWDEVFQGICRNSLLGLTHRYLMQGESRSYPPEGFRRAVQQLHYLNAVALTVKYRHVVKVLTQLAADGIEHMVLKGPALAHLVYPHPSLRIFGDLDLMVRERDMAAAHDCLVRLGFVPELEPAQLPPKLTPQTTTYELKYWHPTLQLLVEVHFDDLLNAGLASRDVEGFWSRAVTIDIQGTPTKVLALDDQLIHLCAHMHYHGYVRLNWFSDIAFIVRDHAAEVNWERLIETVRTEESQVAVYYSLRLLQQLLNIDAPGGVLAALRPDRFRRWWHEYYLPERRVLSLEPMPHPDFSFYFIPLLKRLLPDLLVMGRRREKGCYLLRLLLPPARWLRSYYGLDERRAIAPQYLLHPLKLAYRYSAEVAGAVTRKGRRASEAPSPPSQQAAPPRDAQTA